MDKCPAWTSASCVVTQLPMQATANMKSQAMLEVNKLLETLRGNPRRTEPVRNTEKMQKLEIQSSQSC